MRPFILSKTIRVFDRIYSSCNKLAGFDLFYFPSVQITCIRMVPGSFQWPSLVLSVALWDAAGAGGAVTVCAAAP